MDIKYIPKLKLNRRSAIYPKLSNLTQAKFRNFFLKLNFICAFKHLFKGKNFGSEILDTCTKLTTENRSKENALAGKIEKGPKIKFGKIEKGPKMAKLKRDQK